MKYTAVILILLGMASATKLESSSLAQIESTQQASIDVKSDSDSSDDDSDSNDDETNLQLSAQGDNGTDKTNGWTDWICSGCHTEGKCLSIGSVGHNQRMSTGTGGGDGKSGIKTAGYAGGNCPCRSTIVGNCNLRVKFESGTTGSDGCAYRPTGWIHGGSR